MWQIRSNTTRKTLSLCLSFWVVLENSNMEKLASNQYLLVQLCAKETTMTLTTPVQERYTRFSCPNPQWHSSIVPAKATWRIGRGPGCTSTSNGCAVRPATGSSRNGGHPHGPQQAPRRYHHTAGEMSAVGRLSCRHR